MNKAWRSRVQRILVGLWLGAALLAAAVATIVATSGALSARPGDWTVPLRITRWHTVELNVAGLLRLATTPLALRAIDGFEKTNSLGRLRFVRAGRTLVVRCQPCRIDHPRLASRAVTLPSAELHLTRRRSPAESGRLDGTLTVGAVQVDFVATLNSGSIEVDWALPATDIAAIVGLFGDAVPEQRVARVEGKLAARGSLALPALQGRSSVQIEGFAVDGLDTARYAYGPLRHVCGTQGGEARWVATGEGERGWIALDAMGSLLPAAVVAAEDQRFHEHSGVDATEVEAALSDLQEGTARGASTITQQLARTLVTGGERTLARKLRETLYAAEMERTIGKPRILELYLNTVDWGPGACGASAAARTYFRKRPAQLTPIEAAWLAGILRNPHDAYARQYVARTPDAERATWVLSQMRGLPRRERERWSRRPIAFAAPGRDATRAAAPALAAR
jgi:hypothetical protein